jgi:hypothetical protein
MGFKTFVNGDILDAGEVNDFLMEQSVMVFDDAADRTAQLDGDEAEGMVTYLRDTNQVEKYTGAAFVPVSDAIALDDLTDVDASSPTDGQVLTYNNTSGDWEAANPAVTATEFSDLEDKVEALEEQPANDQTGATYTLQLSDAGKLVTLSNAAAITLTVPTNATAAFQTGQRIDLVQLGAGQVTVDPAAGVTVNSKDANDKLAAQYSAASLVYRGSDVWLLIGDLDA